MSDEAGAGAQTRAAGAPASPDAMVRCYLDGLAAADARDWERFGACYAADVESVHVDAAVPPFRGRAAAVQALTKGFADTCPHMAIELHLVALSGRRLGAIHLTKGTHSQPLMAAVGPVPATGRRIGLYSFHVVEFAPDALEFARDWHYVDAATLLGQIGLSPAPHRPAVEVGLVSEPIVAIASGSAAERDNLAAYHRMNKALNAHDATALADFWAPDAVVRDLAAPADETPDRLLARMRQVFGAFSDARWEITEAWAAGDWVIGVQRLAGTHDGPLPAFGLQPTGRAVTLTLAEAARYRDGRVAEFWVFSQSMYLAAQLGLIEPWWKTD